jgi:hypothetical protein
MYTHPRLMMLVLALAASFNAAGSVALDSAVSIDKRTNTVSNSITVTNTTGAGENRLMLVGVSWNANAVSRTISSVTFTPDGESAVGLTEVKTQQPGTAMYRYAAIYSLLNPPSGQTGTVTITFSGSVTNGIIVGVANFAGVDQTTPLGTPAGAGATNTTPSVTLTGLNGDELAFDTVFIGGNPAPTLTVGANQTRLWTNGISNAGGAASTKQVTVASVTNSWTASASGPWASVAVPIKPARADTTPPTPNPATFAVAPTATGPTAVTMTATVGTDATGPVEYLFTETSGHPGGSSSGWQTNQTYVNTGLNPSTTYSYTVTMRDALANTGTASTVASVTTPAANAITYVGNVGSVSSNMLGTNLYITVGAGGVAAGNTIVVGFASRGAATYNTPVVTDSETNTYNLATNAITYQHGRSYIYYAHVKNALVNGNKITITTSSVSNRVAVASVFSGLLDTNLLDKTLGNPTGSSTTTQGNSPTVGPTATTVQANELVIGVIGTEEATDAGVGTWLNNFTAGPQIKTTGTSANEWRVSLGYEIVSATGQYTAAKTVANNPYWAATIATFKASSAPLPDTNAPVITTCATNRTINAGVNCQAAIPDLTTQVVASDDSGSVTITQSPVAGTLVGLGDTVVTITVSDAATNQATCQATITVIDVTPPVITTCATNRTINAGANCQAAIPDLTTQVVAGDTCGGVTITQSPVAGTLVGLGNTVVTLTVKDAANNQATCQATITVVDVTPPVITTCATNRTINAGANCQAAIPDLTTQVVAGDTCGGVTITQSPVAGTLVGLGDTVVTITVSDAATNQATCQATITVVDGNVPDITAQPQSATNVVGTTVTFTVTATSCSAIGYQWMFGTNTLSGENAATLTITNVPTGRAGDYTVVLTNTAGSITSDIVTLTVLLPAAPTLSASPMLLSNGHFHAGFNGTPNVSYTVKYANDVIGPWQTLTNITSAGSGLIEIDDILAATPARRFYRIVYP